MAAISIKQLLEAGVHFGHQTGRWNPKMKPYIFGERNGIHIIDLQQTLKLFKEAVDFVTNLAAQGKIVLFVGTKSQAQEAIEDEARRCGMYYVNNRWLGGLLTNFATVRNSIRRYLDLESMQENGFYDKLSKKEVARLERERKKLEKNLIGIKGMDRLPDAVFIVDSNHESIAVKEACKLDIPVVAIVDTDCDPDLVEYVIPGNDDALRSVKLFAETIADAILAGKAVYEARVEAETKEAREKAAKEAAQREAAKAAKEAARAAADREAAGETAAEKEAESERESAKTEEEDKKTAAEQAVPDEEAESVAAEEDKQSKPAKKAATKRKKSTSKKAAKKARSKSKSSQQSAEAETEADEVSSETDEEKIKAES